MRLHKKPIIVALAIIFIFAFATNITAQTQPIEFDAYFGLGEYGFDSGYIGLNEVYARMQVRAYGMLGLNLADVTMNGSVWTDNGVIGITGTPNGGNFSFNLGLEYGVYAYYGIPVLNLDYELDLLTLLGTSSLDLRLNDSEIFTPFLLNNSATISESLPAADVLDLDLTEILFPGIPYVGAGVTLDADMEFLEILSGESIYFSNPGSHIYNENSTLPYSGSSTILSYYENADAEVIIGFWPGLYVDAFGYRFDCIPARFPFTVYSSAVPLPFNNNQVTFASSDIQIVNMTLSPPTVDPYGTFQVSGSAEYNTGDPVSEGTAVITIQDGNTYTAAVTGGSFSRYCQAPGNSGTSQISKTVSVTVSDGVVSTATETKTLYINGQGGTGNSYDLITDVIYDYVGDNNSIEWWGKDAFRTTDEEVIFLDVFENLSIDHDLDLMWRTFRPDGSQHFSDQISENVIKADWTWGWATRGRYINGYYMSSHPGKYRVEFFVDGDRKETHYYVVAWDFTQHFLCKDYDSNWQPIGQTNIFSPSDTRAVALHHFEYLAQGLTVRADFYSPNGSLYSSNEYTFEDDLGPHEWYGWARHAGWIWIDDYAAEYMCGDWTVKFYVKNPSSGDWEQKYTDYFRIEENNVPSISVSAAPILPIETQAIALNISASDNNHLQKIILHWNDGSAHSQMWDNINSGSYTPSHGIGSNFIGGQEIEYWAEAWDESGNRAESEHYTFTVIPESITTPDRPSGEKYPQIDASHTYSTGGSTSSLGHSVEYQFEWGDGIQSNWGSAVQSHAWSNEGVYFVRTRARCQLHTERKSSWSTPFTVCVDSTNPIVDITTNSGSDFETTQSQIILEGTTTDPDPASGLASVSINTGDGNEGTLYDWQFTVDLNEGPNFLTVAATDNTDNVGSDSITISYIPVVSITVTTFSAARQITVDSVDYTAPQTFDWEAGSEHTIGVPSPQSGETGMQYIYDHWSDGGDQSHSIIIPSSDTTYTAYFTTQYSLTTSANPIEGGTITPSGTTWHNSDAQVDITATPNTGYEFTGWSGGATGTENPQSVTIDGPKDIVANFTCVTPVVPINPSPGDGATGVSIDADLDWDDCSGATSYDVYFDTTYPPEKVGSVTSSAYDPGVLNDDTTYYWRIVAKNDCDDTTGDLWQFTTAQQLNCTILHKDGAMWSSDIGWEMGTPPYYPDTDYARDLELLSGNDTILIDEDFEGTFPPSGWTVVDNAGTGGVWQLNTSWPRDNYTEGTGNCAAADSDAFELISMDTELRTPAFNLSSVDSAELRFNVHYNNYSGSEYGDVDISTNGGSTWTNLVRYQGADVSGPLTLDITPYCGNANVIIRFHYGNACYDWWFQVDDVQVALKAYTILHKDGALWSSETGWEMGTPPYYAGSDYVVDLEITDSGANTILHRDGALWSSDTGWAMGTPPYYAGYDYARALELREDESYVVLHKEGAVYDSASGWLMTTPPYYPGSEWVVDIKLDESGYVLLHRDGGVWSTAEGWVLDTPPYYPDADYARALELRADGSYVILHKDGAIYDSVDGWNMDTPPYYPGSEYARDLEMQ